MKTRRIYYRVAVPAEFCTTIALDVPEDYSEPDEGPTPEITTQLYKRLQGQLRDHDNDLLVVAGLPENTALELARTYLFLLQGESDQSECKGTTEGITVVDRWEDKDVQALR